MVRRVWGRVDFVQTGGQGSSSSSSYTSFEIYIARLLMMGSSILKNQSCKCFSLSSLLSAFHPISSVSLFSDYDYYPADIDVQVCTTRRQHSTHVHNYI
jgi:hypothetical protein